MEQPVNDLELTIFEEKTNHLLVFQFHIISSMLVSIGLGFGSDFGKGLSIL
jgi:hypothetical protein